MQFILIANPENRRAKFFEEAVKSSGFAAPLVLPYEAILTGKIDLSLVLPQKGILRIESAGENAVVARYLLALGANHNHLLEGAMCCSKIQALQYQPEYGQIAYLQQRHLGFLTFLQQIEKASNNRSQLKLMNSIDAIRICFDKKKCHQKLVQAKINVPEAIYGIQSHSALIDALNEKRWSSVFIKPLHGSSASGVLAYRQKGKQTQLISTTELVRKNEKILFFNSLRIRKYEQHDDIKMLIDFICREGVIVERWLPKASLEAGVFDLRILVIGGKAMHTVIRQSSSSPMTNLHLGNQRGNFTEFLDLVGFDKWRSIQILAEQAVAALPPMAYAGVDIMLDKRLNKAYVLEVNAFGDLIPNTYVDGMDSYTATVRNLKI